MCSRVLHISGVFKDLTNDQSVHRVCFYNCGHKHTHHEPKGEPGLMPDQLCSTPHINR